MTGTPGPNNRHAAGEEPAACPSGNVSLEWWDETDNAIIERLGGMFTLLDPPPRNLVDRVRFCLAMENLDVEVSRLQNEQLVGSGARSTERTRTITFDSARLTIMVSIVEMPDGCIRLDGWLAPPRRLRVELRVAGPGPEPSELSQLVVADHTGRFVFPSVRHGLAQLLVHPTADDGTEGSTIIVTPSLML